MHARDLAKYQTRIVSQVLGLMCKQNTERRICVKVNTKKQRKNNDNNG